MTGADLEKYFPQSKIILFEELKGKNLEKVLPANPDYVILLFELQSDFDGHWVCILRYDNTIEWWDPYGMTPAEVYESNTVQKNSSLNQDKNYASIMIKNFITSHPKYNFIVNRKRFQKMEPGINTCGRWVTFRIKALMKKGMTLHEFYEFYKKTKNLFKNESNDELVSLIVG